MDFRTEPFGNRFQFTPTRGTIHTEVLIQSTNDLKSQFLIHRYHSFALCTNSITQFRDFVNCADCTKIAVKICETYILTKIRVATIVRDPPLYHTGGHLSREIFSSKCTKKNCPLKWGQGMRNKCGRHRQGQTQRRKSGHSCGTQRGVCGYTRHGNNFPFPRLATVRNRKCGQLRK